MKKKRTTLVSNISDIVETSNLTAFQAVFDKCDINAEDRYNGGNALHTYGITKDMIRWFIDNGGEIDTRDKYGRTPLHKQAVLNYNHIDDFFVFGFDVNSQDWYGNTPLHAAAGGGFSAHNVKALIEHGANPLIINESGLTPLEYALSRTQNMDIVDLVTVAKVLLPAQSMVTDYMKTAVKNIGETFEFYRDDFNPQYVSQTDIALNELYTMFAVEPVSKRQVYDGKSDISVTTDTWQEQYDELWDMLVPGSGAASTIQGEVIRICGKVTREICDNGAANWNREYRKLPQALPNYLLVGSQLDEKEYSEFKSLAQKIGAKSELPDLERLTELAVHWVLINPTPIELTKVDYRR